MKKTKSSFQRRLTFTCRLKVFTVFFTKSPSSNFSHLTEWLELSLVRCILAWGYKINLETTF